MTTTIVSSDSKTSSSSSHPRSTRRPDTRRNRPSTYSKSGSKSRTRRDRQARSNRRERDRGRSVHHRKDETTETETETETDEAEPRAERHNSRQKRSRNGRSRGKRKERTVNSESDDEGEGDEESDSSSGDATHNTRGSRTRRERGSDVSSGSERSTRKEESKPRKKHCKPKTSPSQSNQTENVVSSIDQADDTSLSDIPSKFTELTESDKLPDYDWQSDPVLAERVQQTCKWVDYQICEQALPDPEWRDIIPWTKHGTVGVIRPDERLWSDETSSGQEGAVGDTSSWITNTQGCLVSSRQQKKLIKRINKGASDVYSASWRGWTTTSEPPPSDQSPGRSILKSSSRSSTRRERSRSSSRQKSVSFAPLPEPTNPYAYARRGMGLHPSLPGASTAFSATRRPRDHDILMQRAWLLNERADSLALSARAKSGEHSEMDEKESLALQSEARRQESDAAELRAAYAARRTANFQQKQRELDLKREIDQTQREIDAM